MNLKTLAIDKSNAMSNIYIRDIDIVYEADASRPIVYYIMNSNNQWNLFFCKLFQLQDNQFIDTHIKEITRERINKEMKLRWVCRKFLNKLRRLVGISYKNAYTLDLCTCIDDITTKRVIIRVDNCQWVSTVNEMQQVILSHLTKIDMHTYCPEMPRNPYTNIPFTAHQLMLIYMQMYEFKLHNYVCEFAKRYFNIDSFKYYNHTELQGNAYSVALTKMNDSQLETFIQNILHYNEGDDERDDRLRLIKLVRFDSKVPLHVKKAIVKLYLLKDNRPVHDIPFLNAYNIHLRPASTKRTIRKVKRPRLPMRSDIIDVSFM